MMVVVKMTTTRNVMMIAHAGCAARAGPLQVWTLSHPAASLLPPASRSWALSPLGPRDPPHPSSPPQPPAVPGRTAHLICSFGRAKRPEPCAAFALCKRAAWNMDTGRGAAQSVGVCFGDNINYGEDTNISWIACNFIKLETPFFQGFPLVFFLDLQISAGSGFRTHPPSQSVICKTLRWSLGNLFYKWKIKWMVWHRGAALLRGGRGGGGGSHIHCWF